MKIIALNINQSKVSRGLETFLLGLKKEMETREVQFDIVSDEHFFPQGRKNNFFNRVARRLYLDGYSFAVLFFTLKNVAKIIKSKPNILIPTNGGWQVLITRFLRLICRFKVVIIGEAGIGHDDEFNLKHGNPDVFVALTKEQEDWARKIKPNTKIVKIPNGVDVALFSKNGEKIPLNLQKPIFLCVAAFDSYKNIDRTICAVSELNNGSLVVLGDGAEKESLEKLGNEKLGIRFLMKKVNYEDLPKWYRSANVFTLISGSQEAFGNVYIEAMACGLPVVATDDPKRREIVGDAGIFVNVSNVEDYKTALMKAAIINWNDKPHTQSENFSWEKVGEKYFVVLQSIMDHSS